MKPLSLRIDLEVDAGYIAYRRLGDGEFSVRNDRVSQDVIVDYDAAGDIIGIELLAFDVDALEVARQFAEKRGLEFPAVLTRGLPVPV